MSAKQSELERLLALVKQNRRGPQSTRKKKLEALLERVVNATRKANKR